LKLRAFANLLFTLIIGFGIFGFFLGPFFFPQYVLISAAAIVVGLFGAVVTFIPSGKTED